ncbi:hypothetical protein HPG69_010724 [Diceros bicornis minor]|uniref:Ras-related protein Rab-17 n=1 Tax=Diceros bicornis minor TaxID=77932 RepID=A0A7J7EUR2_DICBM|nr:hypothetical protein HPG69_010724 [Diceros bicornis minor]
MPGAREVGISGGEEGGGVCAQFCILESAFFQILCVLGRITDYSGHSSWGEESFTANLKSKRDKWKQIRVSSSGEVPYYSVLTVLPQRDKGKLRAERDQRWTLGNHPGGMAQVAAAPSPGATPGQPCVFKLVLLGSSSVGKSSLALRYVRNDFKSTLPTVGCIVLWIKLPLASVPGAFFTKLVEFGAASLKFEIWDTAGQEKYHSVCHLYFRGANAALLVYDITSKDSFGMAQQWLKDLEKEFQPGEVVVMLVGNKTDLGEEREVMFEEGKEFAESKGLLFMETSARLNHQVTEVFSAVARELLQREERKKDQTQQRDARLALNERPAGQAKCCAH